MAGNKNSGFASHPENINKNGRPKKEQTLTHFINKYLEEQSKEYPEKTYKELLAEAYVRGAISLDSTAMRIVIQYTDGLPVQKIEQEGFMLNNLADILKLKKEYDPDGDITEAGEGGGDMA